MSAGEVGGRGVWGRERKDRGKQGFGRKVEKGGASIGHCFDLPEAMRGHKVH